MAWIGVLTLWMQQQAEQPLLPPHPVATYSIVARDPATGEIGVAVQSHWFSVGSIVSWAEAGVGAVATQSFAREDYGPELLADLRGGLAAAAALEKRTTADAGRAVRQVGVIDAQGRAAAFTGEQCIASAGHLTGQGYSVQANIMVDGGVVPALARGFEEARGDLAERLLQALEAAQLAGGDLRGRQSAALLVVSGEKQPEPWQGVRVDLRVEDHPDPLVELRRLLRVHRAYQAANDGDVHLAAGRVEDALQCYARAEELLPEQVELSYWRAVTLLQQGHEAPAFEMLRRVYARDPAWLEMTPRLAAAGHFPADQALLARVSALAPAFDLRSRTRDADAGRLEADVRKLVSFGTRHTLSEVDSETRGIGAARRWLREAFEEISERHHGGRLHVDLLPHTIAAGPRLPDGAEVVNVAAFLPGGDPNHLVVLSGHYDSRASDAMDARSDAPGANDDASGVAAVLEAARLLGGLQPRATLVFLAVAGEEQSLYGSSAQAAQWQVEGKMVEAMFTLDIVGGARGSSGLQEPWRLRVFSEGAPAAGERVVGSLNDSASRQLARYFKRAGEAAVPGFEITLIFRLDRYLRGGDHRPFHEAGFPAVRLTEPHENYDWQHQDVRVENGVQYGDLPENVDYAYVGRVARAVAAAAGELALAPPPPQAVRMDTGRLTPHTTLRWREPAGAAPAGYALLLRRTHDPDWSERRVVGPVTEVTLEGVSKDDWLFAVEAFDEAGHRSRPIYPAPGR